MIFWGGGFDYNNLASELEKLKLRTNNPNIWKNSDAIILFQKIKIIENKLKDFKRIDQSLKDLKEFYQFAISENDDKLVEQLTKDYENIIRD